MGNNKPNSFSYTVNTGFHSREGDIVEGKCVRAYFSVKLLLMFEKWQVRAEKFGLERDKFNVYRFKTLLI